MLRFLLRHGAVRLIGGRAVPILTILDLALLANRARKIPAVDRGLRRGAAATGRRLGSVLDGMTGPAGRVRPAGRRRDRPPRSAGGAGPGSSPPPGWEPPDR
jgi:hypothetical protein